MFPTIVDLQDVLAQQLEFPTCLRKFGSGEVMLAPYDAGVVAISC